MARTLSRHLIAGGFRVRVWVQDWRFRAFSSGLGVGFRFGALRVEDKGLRV